MMISSHYSRPDKSKDLVVTSYDGCNSYLVVINKISCYVCVFLTQSKEPPLDIVTAFLVQYGNTDDGLVQTDQDGDLACSDAFHQAVLVRKFTTKSEPYDV